MQEIAVSAVSGFGRVEGARSRDWYSQYEVMKTLAVDELLARLQREVLQEPALPALERRLLHDEFERRVRDFKLMTLAVTRRRVAEYRGPEAVASYAVGPLPEDTSFFNATSDLDELRKAIRPSCAQARDAHRHEETESTEGQPRHPQDDATLPVDGRGTVRSGVQAPGPPSAGAGDPVRRRR